ncbi:hypothetical protein LSH36_252g01050 [Paralvinella palmiformis]|uniref:Uncharacterized protein n=1 Tax=Paralvinella palmiformis TaxID=53620 RepID=A0AAD9JLN3_9ANNE|nr:hypothetical protein LSH36_252g01050 [Paralvinella palmiformis]
MWRHLAILGITVLLCCSSNATAGHRSRRQATFSCENTETMVRSPMVYEANISCKEVIGRMADPYKLLYRQECQRWLGLATLPHSVADSYVDECYEYTNNGSVRYKAKFHQHCPSRGLIVLQSTTTEQRCFTCNNATNSYECTYGGQVTTCPNGQVCMTQSKHYRRNGYSRGYRFAQCVPNVNCTQIAKNNNNVCKHYIPSPNCTYCCTGPFCNYMQSDRWLCEYLLRSSVVNIWYTFCGE